MDVTTEAIARIVGVEAGNRLAESVRKIEHCLDQLSDQQVWWRETESQNSIANIILHLCGNVRQWIVSGIGGEPDVRDRPQEFSQRETISKGELLHRLREEKGSELFVANYARTSSSATFLVRRTYQHKSKPTVCHAPLSSDANAARLQRRV